MIQEECDVQRRWREESRLVIQVRQRLCETAAPALTERIASLREFCGTRHGHGTAPFQSALTDTPSEPRPSWPSLASPHAHSCGWQGMRVQSVYEKRK